MLSQPYDGQDAKLWEAALVDAGLAPATRTWNRFMASVT